METMTDTPETDGEWNRLACQDHPEFEQNLADFARKLERERDEIRAQLREEQQLHIQTLNERDELRRTNEGLQLTFDLRWQADRRAIKRWQAAHPGNDLTWPDHADMVVWLMERYSPERVLADRLAALLQRNRDGYGGQMVDPECGCCDCKWLQPIDEALAAWKEARSES